MFGNSPDKFLWRRVFQLIDNDFFIVLWLIQKIRFDQTKNDKRKLFEIKLKNREKRTRKWFPNF